MKIAILIVATSMLGSCAMRALVRDCDPVLCETCGDEDKIKEWVCTVRR